VRAALATRLSSRVGSVITLIDPEGASIPGAPAWRLPRGSLLVRLDHAHGEVRSDDRDYMLATETVVHSGTAHHLLVAVPAVGSRGALPALLFKLITVLSMLGALGVAAALIVTRDITTDVRAIARRALEMAAGEAAVLVPLPVRALDEVGALVAAFNRLQRRFADELEAHKTALARLEDAERRKEALIATLRHELRTPLNAIIGFAELLLSGVDGELSTAQSEDVELIARSGRHLLNLVDDVLDLSAIASGRFTIEPQPVDLVAIAREVAREAAGFARRRKVEIAVEGASRAIVEGDPLSLRRAVTNLVQNAIEYAGGRVVVTVELVGRTATVAVTDNGPGISPRDLKRLFKPFERGRSGEHARSGAGLGLAITVALAELHGGTLGAESEVGKGSTFTMTLPLRPTALQQAGFE
jgi:signal transduction histidine kinase